MRHINGVDFNQTLDASEPANNQADTNRIHVNKIQSCCRINRIPLGVDGDVDGDDGGEGGEDDNEFGFDGGGDDDDGDGDSETIGNDDSATTAMTP